MEEKKKVNLLLVDDHPVVTEGISRLLEQEEGWNVAGIAHTAQEALRLVKRKAFTIALVDISLNGVNGFDLIAFESVGIAVHRQGDGAVPHDPLDDFGVYTRSG